MRIKVDKKKSNFLLLVLGIIMVAVLYWGLLSALPKYAGRVPFLVLLFAVDWLIYRSYSSFWSGASGFFRKAILILWWTPLFLLFLFLFGSIIRPVQDWNAWLRIYIPGLALIAFMSKLIMFAGLLPVYLLQFISFVFNFKKRSISGFRLPVRIFKIINFSLGILVLSLLLTGSVFWVYQFKVHRINIPIKDLPPQFEGLKIVQLSDIHIGSWVSVKPLKRAVNMIMNEKPDLIVFTGDMVNYSSAELHGIEKTLRELKAPMGVYAILGNHDYGDYTSWNSDDAKKANMAELELFYKENGFRLLRNQSDLIKIDSATLLLAGVENWSATSRFKKYGDMKATLDGYAEADVNILLSHDPTHWDAEVTEKYPQFDLTLSGHTHGMQMGIETSWIRWSPSQYLYKEWAGLYPYRTVSGDTCFLYINRGLGHIGYPGRVGILPEITLITLVKGR